MMVAIEHRIKTFKKIWDPLATKKPNFSYSIGDFEDLKLPRDEVKKYFNKALKSFDSGYDNVYTHSPADMHFEHKMVFEEAMLACRLSSAKSLYTTCSSTFLQADRKTRDFIPNYFVDISWEAIQKMRALDKYADLMYIPNNDNDLRSPKQIMNMNSLYGAYVHKKYAEAYEQIFAIV